jgi:hypothetical protein
VNPKWALIKPDDFGAAAFEWYWPATERLRLLCKTTGAVIVLHSLWRHRLALRQMKLLFSLHRLGKHLVDYAPLFREFSRETPRIPREIAAYLAGHPQIEQFVIIGAHDWGFSKLFPNRFVQPRAGFIEQEDYRNALAILGGDPSTIPGGRLVSEGLIGVSQAARSAAFTRLRSEAQAKGSWSEFFDKFREVERRMAYIDATLEYYRNNLKAGKPYALLVLLEVCFGTVSRDIRDRVLSAPIETIEAWLDRAIDAPNLNSVFEGSDQLRSSGRSPASSEHVDI